MELVNIIKPIRSDNARLKWLMLWTPLYTVFLLKEKEVHYVYKLTLFSMYIFPPFLFTLHNIFILLVLGGDSKQSVY